MAQRNESLDRILVITPTYNEAENLAPIIKRLRDAVPSAHSLIADDNSPDGTGAIADRMAAEDPAIHVLHRPGKQGLAAAYLAGFAWGLERNYDVLVEMDADGSHAPEQLPDLLAQFSADISADTAVVLFVVDAKKEMALEVNGAKVYMVPLSEGMAWNELIDLLALEKSDFKGQSAADKVVTLYKAVLDYKPSKFPVVSVEEAMTASNGAKREMWGAV